MDHNLFDAMIDRPTGLRAVDNTYPNLGTITHDEKPPSPENHYKEEHRIELRLGVYYYLSGQDMDGPNPDALREYRKERAMQDLHNLIFRDQFEQAHKLISALHNLKKVSGCEASEAVKLLEIEIDALMKMLRT